MVVAVVVVEIVVYVVAVAVEVVVCSGGSSSISSGRSSEWEVNSVVVNMKSPASAPSRSPVESANERE